jgi:cobalamin-dependent methionine synthase I
MLIVGERINTSRKSVNEAVEQRDAAYITADVQRQVKAGADYIDVNAGSRIGSEMDDLQWLVGVVEAAVNVPLAVDSPDPKILQAIARQVKKRPMINSTTAELSRWEAMKGVLQERECDIVALCMDDRGIPKTVDEALQNASFLVRNLTQLGVPLERIHLDPMIQPIGMNTGNGSLAMETIRGLKREFPEVRTICGLSNVSFGLPHRALLNRLFLVLCLGAGLTGAIVDPLDQKMMSHVLAAETLIGRDDYCMKYLGAHRAGTLV